jgi:hypothetical protein
MCRRWMTLQEATEQGKTSPPTAIRPVAWNGKGVGLIWDQAENGWIGWDFRGKYPRVICDEYRLPALGFSEWQLVSFEQLRVEGEIT